MAQFEGFKPKNIQEATTVTEREIKAEEGLAGSSMKGADFLEERKIAAILRKVKQCAASQIRKLKVVKSASKDALSKVIELLSGKSFEPVDGLPCVSKVSSSLCQFKLASG